ncbi:hypothetical protein JNB11_03170 [Kocuria palustris]|nr:hypothetical protein [Kocuria palustris]
MPQYNVIIYDRPDANRLEVRPKHFAGIPQLVEGGALLAGGAIFKDDSCLLDQFAGSWLHVEAENQQAVMEILKRDPYAVEGVWDLDNVIIHPMTAAVRLPVRFPGVDEKMYQKTD